MAKFRHANGWPVMCAVLALNVFGSTSTFAQTTYAMINREAATSHIKITAVRPHISMLEGSGGNMTVLTGPDGILLVDAGIAVSRPKLQAAIASLETAPIKYAVNTHWHWDHTDGNGWLHAGGTILVAHPNTVRHLGQTIRIDQWGHTFTPVQAGARPTLLVADDREIAFDAEKVRIHYYGPSHTDGDLSVFFVKANVLATGDTWWNGMYPFIDYKAGGSIDGMIMAANANIAMTEDDTVIIPGHGAAGTRAQLIQSRDMLVGVRDAVAKLKHQGMTVSQVIATRPTAAYDANFGEGIFSASLFTSLVYRGV